MEERKARYVRVLDVASQFGEFSVKEIQQQAEEKHSSLINRIVTQLTQEGLLQQVSDGETNKFRWTSRGKSLSLEGWIDRQIFGTQITQTPMSDRPRERLRRCGVESLRTAELLAVLIRTGRKGESALEAGERIANRAGDRPELLRGLSPAEYREITPVFLRPSSVRSWRVSSWDAGSWNDDGRSRTASENQLEHRCHRLRKRHFYRLAVDRQQKSFTS